MQFFKYIRKIEKSKKKQKAIKEINFAQNKVGKNVKRKVHSIYFQSTKNNFVEYNIKR